MVDPDQVHLFITYFELFHNDTRDFQVPHLRKALRYVYPLFVFLYALLVLVGTSGNICLLVAIARRRLYRDPTFYFLGNLALADLVKCVVVLPATLANLLIFNWLFGSFLCYLLPMMQYIPIHASMLTFLLIAVDRYRLIVFPLTSRVPRLLCVLGIWVLSVCVVLPFAIYTTYFDLGSLLGPSLDGTGLCTINVKDDMEEYLRALFIILYVMPLAIIAFLHLKISGEIKAREKPLSAVVFENSSADERSRSTMETRGSWLAEDGPDPRSGLQHCHGPPNDEGFDPEKEKRTQKYLVTMVVLFAACLCPLEIMKLVKDIVAETHDNTGHYDIAYVIVVWVGFLPTCTTPILAASWMMSRPTKDRLRGYFQLSGRWRQSNPAPEFGPPMGVQGPPMGVQGPPGARVPTLCN